MGHDRELANVKGAKIKVIGVGGGGGNAVNTMIRAQLDGVEFYAANTDVQSLKFSLAPHKIQLGKDLTKGLGAGADPDIGRDAALEDRHEIQEAIGDADMVFITAGMGGGTGTGAASIVAQIAREMGVLTVAVVTKPFQFEGKRRRKHAELGISRLRECVDTLVTIPNQRLLQIATPDLSMIDAFKMADNVLVNAVKGISDIINIPGTVNVDFADVKAVMSCMGHALMGIGLAQGDDRAAHAARQAISSPLLEDVDIEGATGILINITAGSSVSLLEINEACSIVQEAAHEDANIIFGAVIDESMGETIRVTVIATGFPVPESEDNKPASLIKGPSLINISKPLIAPIVKHERKPEPISYVHPEAAFEAAPEMISSAVNQTKEALESIAEVESILSEIAAEAPEVIRAGAADASVHMTSSDPIKPYDQFEKLQEDKYQGLSELESLAQWTMVETFTDEIENHSFQELAPEKIFSDETTLEDLNADGHSDSHSDSAISDRNDLFSSSKDDLDIPAYLRTGKSELPNLLS